MRLIVRSKQVRAFVGVIGIGLASTLVGQAAPKPQFPHGRLVETRYTASSLAGNLLGDPVEQAVSIYLPPDYETARSRRYPAVYLLHGYGGKVGDWTTHGYQGLDLQPAMDDLIASGRLPPMIIVVPNGRNAYLGSFFTNSAATGRWGDAIATDLVAFVDGRFRTIPDARSRGIAGHSMGGYGAIMLALDHPETFGSVYAMSPCCVALEADAGAENPVWPRVLALKSRDELPKEPETLSDFWTVVFVALSAALSPNPQRPPFYADFPYEEKDGHLVPAEPAFSRWRSRMPLYLVEARRTTLLSLHGLAIDVGDRDDFSHIRRGTRLLSDALAERDVPHLYEIYADGDHGNRIRERLVHALEFFAAHLRTAP